MGVPNVFEESLKEFSFLRSKLTKPLFIADTNPTNRVHTLFELSSKNCGHYQCRYSSSATSFRIGIRLDSGFRTKESEE